MFTNYDLAFGPLQSNLIYYLPFWSNSVHNGSLQSILFYLPNNRGKKKGLGWEYYIAINYLSSIHCNYMISFDYHYNLLRE